MIRRPPRSTQSRSSAASDVYKRQHIAFPLRLERCDVDDDAAARISGLAQADGQYTAWDAEIFDGTRQRKRIGRDDAVIGSYLDEGIWIEILRIDDGAVDVGEQLEFVGAANIVTIAGCAIRYDALAVDLLHLIRLERFDHFVLLRHAAYPFV